MSGDRATIPAGSFRILASGTNIPGSGSGVLEIEDSTTQEFRAMEIWNSGGATVNIYTGPDANLDLFCIMPGLASAMIKMDRAPINLSAGTRLSVRAVAAGAISTGELVINFWR